jgi:hypothetical protein
MGSSSIFFNKLLVVASYISLSGFACYDAFDYTFLERKTHHEIECFLINTFDGLFVYHHRGSLDSFNLPIAVCVAA